MTVHVLLFGHYKEAAPVGAENGAFSLEVPAGATVADVARLLSARSDRLQDLLVRTRVAVGAEFAAPEMILADDDEVAFLPPMSGG